MIVRQSYFSCLFGFIFCLFCGSLLAQNNTKGEGLDAWVKAEKLKSEKKYDLAITEYNKALKAEPENYNYHYSKGNCLLIKGDTAGAVQSFEKTVAIKNDYVKPYDDMAKIFEKQKSFDKAIENYEKCITYDADTKKQFSYKIEIIRILNKAKKYEDVGKYVSRAKVLYANNLDLLKLEARNNNILQRYDSVIFYMQQAIKLVQGRPAAEQAPFYYEIGHAYYNMGQYDKANPMLEKGNFGPFRPKVYKMTAAYQTDLAVAYADVYEYSEAEKFLEKALKIDAKYKQAINLQKEISGYKIDQSTLIRKLEDSAKVEKNPKKKADEYCRLCNMQFTSLQYDGAMLAAEECLKMNPRNMKVIFLKSVSSFKSGNTDEAIGSLDRFSRSPQLSPEFLSKCYLMLGFMYKQSKDLKTAESFFRNRKIGGVYRQAAMLEWKKLKNGGDGTSEEEEFGGEEPTEPTKE